MGFAVAHCIVWRGWRYSRCVYSGCDGGYELKVCVYVCFWYISMKCHLPLLSVCLWVFFPHSLCSAAICQPVAATQSQIETLDAVKVREAADWQTTSSLSVCLSGWCVSLYIRMTALVDVLGVPVILNPSLQLLYVVTDWERSWKDTGCCSCGCSHQRTLLDFDLNFAGNL